MSLITNEMIDSLDDRECKVLLVIVNDIRQKLGNREIAMKAKEKPTIIYYLITKIYKKLEIKGLDKRSVLLSVWQESICYYDKNKRLD